MRVLSLSVVAFAVIVATHPLPAFGQLLYHELDLLLEVFTVTFCNASSVPVSP